MIPVPVFSHQISVFVGACGRHVEDVFSVIFFCPPRRLQDILKKTSYKDMLLTSARHPKDILKPSFEDILKKSLEDVMQTRLEDVMKPLR